MRLHVADEQDLTGEVLPRELLWSCDHEAIRFNAVVEKQVR